MFDLKGKKALVTGAAGGIGSAVSAGLAANGASVILAGSNAEKLAAFAASGEVPNNLGYIAADLAAKDGASNLIKQAIEKGGFDILVCNAGITADGLAMRMKDEDWDRVIQVNLTSTFTMVREAVKVMMKNRWGRIICVTSVIGHMGNPGQANYAASKAGVAGMVRSVAMEVASRGVTVNCVAPGFIQTPMTEKLNDEQKAKITSNIPAGRLGDAGDVAGSVVFLASDSASYITGQTVHVNGGLYTA